MTDREKVIKAIETHISTDDSVGCDDCTYENDGWCMTRVMTDALTLLKEQPDIIRCKECKHWDAEEHDCNIKTGWFACGADWYCADGERKSDDA